MRRERILIVDPNPLDGAALRAGLCESGFDAVESSSADGALALVPSFQPAAVLVDGSLPDADPAGFVARLRGLRSDAAVVVATALDRIDAAVTALRAGAETYVVRPLDAGQVLVATRRRSSGGGSGATARRCATPSGGGCRSWGPRPSSWRSSRS